MIDAIKDYLAPKTFGILTYVCSIVRILFALVFISIVVPLKREEAEEFACIVASKSTAAYKTVKTEVDKECYSRYEQSYNSPLPFYGFVILSTLFPIVVAVVYSLCVRNRVQEIDSRDEIPTEGEAQNQVQNAGETLYVFYFYFFHLAVRVLSGILFTVLQYAVFFPSGFQLTFNCTLPSGFTSKISQNASAIQLNNLSIACEDSSASQKYLLSVVLSAINMVFPLLIFVEAIRLCLLFPNCDTEFITVYLLRKQYARMTPQPVLNLEECIDFYKRQILEPSRTTDVIYGPKTGLDDLYINLVIHTERAKHKFSRNMERHEKFDVYMEVPKHSIRLQEAKDIFYPNEDTKGESPRTILAVGRPGIGKTVLTEKTMRDWANGVDEYFCGKIAFYFKFRWFNSNEMKNMTLKTFLRYGTGLSDERFDIIYEYVTTYPRSVILIFDGLDEFNANVDCLDDLQPPNDPNHCMSAISLFIKLVFGLFLPNATVLVTSRPTANEFYSRFTFDRTVEIIGFTPNEIEEYVSKFCENHNRRDLKPKLWNHIKSSSDLLNLCYNPVNCFIVSTILFECLSDPRKDTGGLPTTLTELYQAAITHYDKHHHKKLRGQSSEEAMKKLQSLAYDGIAHGHLVFDNELFDEQMKRSGLLNSLSNPYSQAQTQFCFIHLTIQEFLAARHVTKTFTVEEIKEFILCHIKSGHEWHLVLQFIAGLLGKRNYDMNCVLGFTESFVVKDGILDLTDCSHLFVLKCLREVNDERIVKEACETTAMKDVVSLNYYPTLTSLPLTPTDWAAVTFVCKHMKKLRKFVLHLSNSDAECYLEVNILLQQRCIKQLTLVGSLFGGFEAKHLCNALVESKCALKHEHCKLTELNIQSLPITNEDLSTMCKFFKDGHASCLEKLSLLNLCGMSSEGVSILCEVLNNEVCPELTYLDLSYNQIYYVDVKVLCGALQRQFKLTQLFLRRCSYLNDFCIRWLCELISDERCNLTALSLDGVRQITDTGLRNLCKFALTKKHCKLTKLSLFNCSLTDRCIPKLRETLQDEHCTLNELVLGDCMFSEAGKNALRELETLEQYKDRGLKIDLLDT